MFYDTVEENGKDLFGFNNQAAFLVMFLNIHFIYSGMNIL